MFVRRFLANLPKFNAQTTDAPRPPAPEPFEPELPPASNQATIGSGTALNHESEIAWQSAWDTVTSFELPSAEDARRSALNFMLQRLLDNGPITTAIMDEVVRLATEHLYIEGREHFGGYAHDGSGAIKTSSTAALDGLSGLIEQFTGAGHPYPYLAAVEELFDGAAVFAATSIDNAVAQNGETPAMDAALPVVSAGVGSLNSGGVTGAPVVPEQNVYADAQAQAREALLALGLDGTTPSNTPVYVVDLLADHAQSILNALQLETSLIQGANVQVTLETPAIELEGLSEELQAALAAQSAIRAQSAELWTYEDMVLNAVYADPQFFLENIARLNSIDHTSGVGFANMSFGRSELVAVESMLEVYAQLPADGPARTTIDANFTTRFGYSPSNSAADQNLLLQLFLTDFRNASNLPENQQLRQESIALLNARILEREAEGLMLFVSGGNDLVRSRTKLSDLRASTSLWGEVEAAQVVGALGLGSATRGDEFKAHFASTGPIDFLAPGIDIPVSPGADSNTNGASYSAPYVLQIAYLIYQDSVQRGAPMSVAQIEAVLQNPLVLQEVSNGNVGAPSYAPDPVYAVLAARGFTSIEAIEAELVRVGSNYRPVVSSPPALPTEPQDTLGKDGVGTLR